MIKRNHFTFSNPATEFLAVALISLSLLGPAIAEDAPPKRPDPPARDDTSVKGEASDDLINLLPFLVTSPDEKRLATELLASMDQGDLPGAESNLNAAIKVGTLAITLIDRLHDPSLLPALQGLGIPSTRPLNRSDGATIPAACSVPATPTAANVAAMQEALDQERERSTTAERELARAQDAMRSLNALRDKETASAARIAELEGALSQAQVRRDELARMLVDVTETLRRLQEGQEQDSASLMFWPAALLSLSQDRGAVQTLRVLPSALAGIPSGVGEIAFDHAASAHPVQETVPIGAATNAVEAPPPPINIASTGSVAEAKLASGAQTKASSHPQDIRADDRLTIRAEELLRKGDVSGARLLLERSLESGNARAAFLLAETFDPRVLSELGVRGIRGDADKAREFYAKAQALGLTQATARLEALK